MTIAQWERVLKAEPLWKLQKMQEAIKALAGWSEAADCMMVSGLLTVGTLIDHELTYTRKIPKKEDSDIVVTIRRREGEYRVPGPNKTEAQAYYTDDRQDAINTACLMHLCRPEQVKVRGA